APCWLPLIPRACSDGSSRAKLLSLYETDPTLRPSNLASSMMRGFRMWIFPNGIWQYRLKDRICSSRVQFVPDWAGIAAPPWRQSAESANVENFITREINGRIGASIHKWS